MVVPRPVATWMTLVGMAGAGSARAAAAVDPAVFREGLAAQPGLWGVMALALIGATAIWAHVRLFLAERRAAADVEDARRSLEHANYQEAWQACRRGAAACLARVLGPGLERIGQGHEHVEAAVTAAAARERRGFRRMQRIWLVVGVIAPTLTALVGWAGLAGRTRPETTGMSAREVTMAGGNFAPLAAVGFAVAVASLVGVMTARRRFAPLVSAAETEAQQRLTDLPYEDLAGLRIGRDFDAGTLTEGDEPVATTTGRLRVSRTLTTACPRCNAAINASHRTCPHCGLGLDWA